MPVSRRQFLFLGAAGLPVVAPLLGRSDKRDSLTDPAAVKDMITPETQRAIDQGLSYLAQSQRDDGGWGNGQYTGNIAVTSLAALAMMAGGHQPGRGKYGQCVEKALEYVLNKESRDVPGLLNVAGGSTFGLMYSHGFGTLFLAEAYGMVAKKDKQKRLRETLQRAVELTVRAQNKIEGGWRYDVKGTSSDVSVTICQIMALRSARNAGLKVPDKTVDDCVKYVKLCQNRDGGFNYMKSSTNNSAFPRSAAGVVALYCAGIYEGKEIDRGLDYLRNNRPTGRVQPGGFNRGGEMHYFYGHYYAAQAMWTAGGKYWQEWFPIIREELLGRLRGRNDGSWADPTVCTDYGTAMALIILQIPNNYLPIMQK